jgi:hypothetical protein
VFLEILGLSFETFCTFTLNFTTSEHLFSLVYDATPWSECLLKPKANQTQTKGDQGKTIGFALVYSLLVYT